MVGKIEKSQLRQHHRLHQKQKLLFIVSDHGFGHLAQMSPIINDPRLSQAFDIVIQSTLPQQSMQELIKVPLKYIMRRI